MVLLYFLFVPVKIFFFFPIKDSSEIRMLPSIFSFDNNVAILVRI